MKKFMRTWLIVLVGGFILFGVFRYTINPQITANSFCKRSSTCLHGLILNDSSAAKLRYSADGRYLFGAGGGRIKAWDVENKYSSKQVGGYSVKSFVLSNDANDNRWLVNAKNNEIRVFDFDNKRLLDFSTEGEGPQSNRLVSLDTTKDLVAIANRDMLTFWGAINGNFVTELPHSANISSLDAAKGIVAAGLSNGEVVLWPVADFSQYTILQASENAIQKLQFALGGERMMLVDSENKLSLWDTTSGERLNDFEKIDYLISGVGLSGDGSVLAASYANGLITLWDTETAKELVSWSYSRNVMEVAFAPTKPQLAVSLSKEASIVETNKTINRNGSSLNNTLEDSYVEVSPGAILIEDVSEYVGN